MLFALLVSHTSILPCHRSLGLLGSLLKIDFGLGVPYWRFRVGPFLKTVAEAKDCWVGGEYIY